MAADETIVTAKVLGAGGAVWEMDIPVDEGHSREAFDARVASGDLVFVEGDPRLTTAPEPEPEPGYDDSAVPDGLIPDVQAWVGDNLDRAQQALDVEQAKGDGARVTLVSWLEEFPTGI